MISNGKGYGKERQGTRQKRRTIQGIKGRTFRGNKWFKVRKKIVRGNGKIWKLRCETLKFENVKFNFEM